MRPASEKRQGTKSRREVVRRRCRKLYGVLVTGVSWRPDDLPRAIRVERRHNLNVTARILLNGEFTFCPIHDFNELRVARERDRQLVRDEVPDSLWDERQHRAIDSDFESLGRPSWTFLICSSRQSIVVLSRVTAFPDLMIFVFSEVAARDVCDDAWATTVTTGISGTAVRTSPQPPLSRSDLVLCPKTRHRSACRHVRFVP